MLTDKPHLLTDKIVATLVGSMPGSDVWETTAVVRGELPDLPMLPELPNRGPGADMIGRTMAMLAGVSSEFAVMTTPTRWRLAGHRSSAQPAVMRRASSWLAEDLDASEASFADYAGAYKVQLAGPWTLAACVEGVNGDVLIADAGAVNELREALLEAATLHLQTVKRRLSKATVALQIDEPMLMQVHVGDIRTPSGLRAHAPISMPRLIDGLNQVFDHVHSLDVSVGVHTCAELSDVMSLVLSRLDFLSLALTSGYRARRQSAAARAALDEAIGTLWDRDRVLLAGLEFGATQRPSAKEDSAVVRALLHRLGVSGEEVGRQLVVTPECGLSSAPDLTAVRRITERMAQVVRVLDEGREITREIRDDD